MKTLKPNQVPKQSWYVQKSIPDQHLLVPMAITEVCHLIIAKKAGKKREKKKPNSNPTNTSPSLNYACVHPCTHPFHHMFCVHGLGLVPFPYNE
jgi:hypothetical protein